MLEEERIGPELRMQDFDKYMSLMNGLVRKKNPLKNEIKSKANFF